MNQNQNQNNSSPNRAGTISPSNTNQSLGSNHASVNRQRPEISSQPQQMNTGRQSPSNHNQRAPPMAINQPTQNQGMPKQPSRNQQMQPNRNQQMNNSKLQSSSRLSQNNLIKYPSLSSVRSPAKGMPAPDDM